jgi:putative transposase
MWLFSLSYKILKQVGQGVSEFRSVEGVEDLATLALQIGASDETENLTGDGQNVLTL